MMAYVMGLPWASWAGAVCGAIAAGFRLTRPSQGVEGLNVPALPFPLFAAVAAPICQSLALWG